MIQHFFDVVVAIQSVMIILFSFVILQRVLNKSTTWLRLTFLIFPIASAIELVNLIFGVHSNISQLLLGFGVLCIIDWFWIQRSLFHEFEYILATTSSNRSITDELKCIGCCFAIWLLRKIGDDEAAKCVVCESIK